MGEKSWLDFPCSFCGEGVENHKGENHNNQAIKKKKACSIVEIKSCHGTGILANLIQS
jgi:hypothetical protein